MFKKAMIAGAVLVAAMGAQAQSAGFSVTGTITPMPCTVTLTGGGVADYGTLNVNTVKAWGVVTVTTEPSYTAPPSTDRTIPMTVSCTTPTKFAMSIVDNKASSALLLSTPDGIRFGLGTSGSSKIGAYYLEYSGLTIKPLATSTAAAPAKKFVTTGVATASSTWTAPVGFEANYMPAGKSLAFAATAAATTPDSLVEVSGNLKVGIHLSKALVDGATSNIALDGAGTITLVAI